jgi:hypothetical protein
MNQPKVQGPTGQPTHQHMAQPGLAITHERARRPGLLDQPSSEPDVLAAGAAPFIYLFISDK